MRGHYEESPEQKAANALKLAARRFAAKYLVDMFDAALEEYELQKAAHAWAEAVAPKKTARKRSAKDSKGGT